MIPQTCHAGGRFSRCHEEAINTCQYCGRGFCRTHTEYLNGVDAVCSRKACAAKIRDLRAHEEYKAAVLARNRSGLCGIENCGPHPGHECSLCLGKFCREHVQPRMYPFFNGYSTVDRPVSCCGRCWQRRKLWRH
jgi:hypothetical protein